MIKKEVEEAYQLPHPLLSIFLLEHTPSMQEQSAAVYAALQSYNSVQNSEVLLYFKRVELLMPKYC
jgi:hypothetical protein